MTELRSWVNDWRTVVIVLLVAASLGLSGAGMDAFSNDEIRSVIVAGGAHYGPLTYPQGIIERLSDESPDQAFGFPLVARPWGEMVGWHELTTRVLPVLADPRVLGSDVVLRALESVGIAPWVAFLGHIGVYGAALAGSLATLRPPLDLAEALQEEREGALATGPTTSSL